jgi:hypothetical protein
MSGRKLVLLPYHDPQFIAGDISGDIKGTPIGVEYIDNVCVQVSYTGTASGTVSVQFSLDYDHHHIASATWTTVLTETLPTATSPIYINLNQVAAPFMRVIYTKTGGTGTMDVWVSGKEI